MHENITLGGLDETETLVVLEPLDGAFDHTTGLLSESVAATEIGLRTSLTPKIRTF
jgi:hypothetical protein